MISNIEVKKLFGVFTHCIKLDTTKNITLILGENGLGKTIIPKLVQAFCDGNLAVFREYVYDVFILEFADQSRLVVTRNAKTKMRPDVLFEYYTPKKKKPQQYELPDLDIYSHRSKRHFEPACQACVDKWKPRMYLATIVGGVIGGVTGGWQGAWGGAVIGFAGAGWGAQDCLEAAGC